MAVCVCVCVTVCTCEALCSTVWWRGCISASKSDSGQCHSSASGSKYPWEPSPWWENLCTYTHIYTHTHRHTATKTQWRLCRSTSDTTRLGLVMSHSTSRLIWGNLNSSQAIAKTSDAGVVTTLTPNQLAWKSDTEPTLRMWLAVTATFVAIPLGYTAQL